MVDKVPKIIVSEMREEKPGKRFPKKLIYLVIFIILIILLVYFLFSSSFFEIKKVEINETRLVESEKIKKIVEFSYANQKNILLFDDSEIETKVKDNFPLISEVIVQKGIPDTLRVTIKEREPFIIWKSGSKEYFVDKEGIAYLEATEERGVPVIIDTREVPVELGNKILSSGFLHYASEINQKFNSFSGLEIEELRIDETIFDLIVKTKSGFSVFFDTTRSVDEGLSDLKRVLDHLGSVYPKEYIDLRVEGWAYYK